MEKKMCLDGNVEEVLCNFNDKSSINDLEEELKILWSCNWFPLVDAPVLVAFYKSNLKEFVKNEEQDLFSSAIACLLAFIQENFVGPRLSGEYQAFLKDKWPKNVDSSSELTVDSEELNANVKLPQFLLTAKVLIQYFLRSQPGSPVLNWWKLRVIYIHQKVLDELSQSLFMEFTEVAKILLGQLQVFTLEIRAQLLVEICFGYLMFNRTHKAEKYLQQACSILNIELSVEGLLGIRTKFQQKPLPQLCLKVQQNAQEKLSPTSETNGKTKLPKLLTLDDDVLLEKIKFLSDKDNVVMTLPSIVQTVILLKLKLLLKSQPKDRLADEELEPYINTLLYQEHGPLPLRLSVLLLNISQEKNNKRTVERSLKQCEEVLKIIEGDSYSVFEKFSFGFASAFLPRWEIQKQLANLMVSLGLIKTALDIYIEIQAWEEVIECYTRLDLRHKAADIIRQELKKKSSVKMFCLLGDVTDDISWYETAWKFSNETSGLVQRHWGSYYFAKKDYENALPHLQKSLEINSLQEVMWLRLGYVAIMLEKWELAVQAYLTYTHIEPYGFESWNNLANALIKLGDKKRAHKILQEALKCNYNNWKVWENFMLVSVDTGNLEDALNAYSRLNELKEKFIDLEVLEIVVTAIIKNISDAPSNYTERLCKKCNALLAHQCVQHASEHKLWELAALLADSPLSRAQKLQKCYLTYMQKNRSWVNTRESCLKLMDICKRLCENSLDAIGSYAEAEKSAAVSQLSSARLSVQAFVRAMENYSENLEEFQAALSDLEIYLIKISDELKKIL